MKWELNERIDEVIIKMKNLHEYTDLWAVGVGLVGSLLKGLKKKLGMRTLVMQMIIGGILAYGTIGVVDQFFSHLNERVVIVIAFAVGWGANEITEYLDDAIKSTADKYIGKIKKDDDGEA